jgi:hypothetical protein
MTIRIERSGSLYLAHVTSRHAKNEWGSPSPLSTQIHCDTLKHLGCHSVDIMDAPSECDMSGSGARPTRCSCGDGWGGYNKVGGAHQMCLVHVNREFQRGELIRGIELRGFLKDEKPRYTRAGRPPAQLLCLLLLGRAVMKEAVEFSRDPRRSVRAREKAARRFTRRTLRVARRAWKDRDAARIAKALRRWAPSMFTFVARPEIPWENNASERSIRGPVLVRKTTNGHRTDEGAAAFAALMSVRQTSELKGRNVLDVLRGLMGAPGPPWSGG